MKKHFAFFTFISLIFISCVQNPPELVIQFEDYTTELRYWPQGSYFNLATVMTLEKDSTVRLTLSEDIPLHNIKIGNKFIKVYATPNSIDTLQVLNDTIIYKGDNKPYNEVLAVIENAENYCWDFMMAGKEHELKPINELHLFKEIIEKRKKTDYDLLQNSKFSRKFVQQQQLLADIRYLWLFFNKVMCANPALTDDWLKEAESIKLNLKDESAVLSIFFPHLLRDYAGVQEFILKSNSPDNIEDFNTFFFNSYCNLLHDKNLEYALADMLYTDISGQRYTESTPILYERFMEMFPNSKYETLLSSGVVENIKFHNPDKKNDKIIFIKYDTEPEDFEDIIKPFKGKVVYVDIWATWCGPCVRMFSYLDDLKDKIKDLEVEHLYISIDGEEYHDKWIKMTHHHNLEGYNYLVNEYISKSVFATFGDSRGTLTIPRYIIIDKNGAIAYENAASPNEPDKLAEQLKSVL